MEEGKDVRLILQDYDKAIKDSKKKLARTKNQNAMLDNEMNELLLKNPELVELVELANI